MLQTRRLAGTSLVCLSQVASGKLSHSLPRSSVELLRPPPECESKHSNFKPNSFTPKGNKMTLYYTLGLGMRPDIYHEWDDMIGAAEREKFKELTSYHASWETDFVTERQCRNYLKAFENYPSKLDWELGLKPYYAVGVGDRPGVYDTWNECRRAIGYKTDRRPQYRKFPTIRQCLLFVKAYNPTDDDEDSDDDDDFCNSYGLFEQVGCRAEEIFLNYV